MNSAVANRIFGSPRVPINTASRPDWARLAKQLRMWKSEDRQAGGPIESYGRYLEWSRAASPDDDDLGRAVAFFTARTASPPDEPLWRILCAAAARPRAPNPYDLALAWAAGWRGDRQRPPFTPGRVGELAVLALVEQVQAALLASIRLLAAQTGLAIVTPDENRVDGCGHGYVTARCLRLWLSPSQVRRNMRRHVLLRRPRHPYLGSCDVPPAAVRRPGRPRHGAKTYPGRRVRIQHDVPPARGRRPRAVPHRRMGAL